MFVEMRGAVLALLHSSTADISQRGERRTHQVRLAACEHALKAAGVRYEAYIYLGVQHGFNNDRTLRFDEAAAKLAWQRTIAFLKRELRT